MQGRSHEYIPDFLVRLKPRDDDDPVRTLIVEVSGTLKKEAPTTEKANTTRDLWVPAVNGNGGFGRWGYAELRDPKTFRADLTDAIEALYLEPSEFAREGASAMPPRKKQPTGPVPVEAFKHDDKRVNIPTADSGELVSPDVAQPKPSSGTPATPTSTPSSSGRARTSRTARTWWSTRRRSTSRKRSPPRSSSRTCARSSRSHELTLFDDFDGLEGYEAVEYYKHEANWSNRMILGDSLQVMASLAEKENLRGKVQMVYIDPPYGIRFGSNWQTSTGTRDVRDGKAGRRNARSRADQSIPRYVGTRHSLIPRIPTRPARLSRANLLTESGSVFVQIGDENVHRVRALLDEVFGAENCVSQITFLKTSSSTGEFGGTADYVLWYARSRDDMKFYELFHQKATGGTGGSGYTQVQLADGTRRPLTKEEVANNGLLPPGGRIFAADNLTSQSAGRMKGEGAASWFKVEMDGQEYDPGMNARWKTNSDGMTRLLLANRILAPRRGKKLAYLRYLDDFPATPIGNVWTDTLGQNQFGGDKVYVVQTAIPVIERCMLMTTDPGDLVLDPTCGSGTTAFVAEEWGRRWITFDTSRVALALARQRIMGAQFPFYNLADSAGDVRRGFVYKRIPHITLKSIATNPDIKPDMSRKEIEAAITKSAESEFLYDQAEEDSKKVRVSGPFTVESLSPHSTVAPVRSESEKTAAEEDGSAFEKSIIDNLLKAGVQNGRKAERLLFESLVPFAGERIQAEGVQRDTQQRIAVSIGPQFGTVDPEWIRLAAREATRGLGFDVLLVCAFAFDPQAMKATEEFSIGRVRVVLVRMNSDLAMGDVLLKKTGSGNLFTIFGEPDVAITRDGDELTVEIKGVDVYNPTTGEIRSSGTGEIALWMIDTDYDEESFFVRHCYFTGDNDPYKRLKAALKADIDPEAWETLYQTKSRPFRRPEKGKIAVKVINHYGDEVLQVYEV